MIKRKERDEIPLHRFKLNSVVSRLFQQTQMKQTFRFSPENINKAISKQDLSGIPVLKLEMLKPFLRITDAKHKTYTNQFSSVKTNSNSIHWTSS
jgi:hypothetical protein